MFTISTGPLITGFLASGGEVAKKTRRTHLVKSMVYEGYIYIYSIYIYVLYIYICEYIYMMNPLGGLCTSTRHAEFRLTVERSKLGTASSGRCALNCGAWKP